MNDRLFELFSLMLNQSENIHETATQLIERVADSYLIEIQQNAGIPGPFIEDVLEDLQAETLIMYRKTTYGYFSLREFREAKLLSKNS